MIAYKTIVNQDAADWVVFVHGAGGSSNVWFKQVRDFSRRYNLLFVDLRGHGDSSKSAKSVSKVKKKREPDIYQKFTIEQIASDVMEVVQSLGLKSCHFVGLSLGGIVIRQIAETHIHLVKSMTMAGAVMKFNSRSKFLSWVANLTKHIFPYMWIYRIYARLLMPSKANTESRKLFIAESLKITRDDFMKWMTLNKGLNKILAKYWDVEPPVRTAYVMGEDDYIFISQVKMYMQTHDDYSRLVILPGAGHICNVEAPVLFNQVVLAFLSEIDEERGVGQGSIENNAGDGSKDDQ